jgi:hypothetical protein
MPLLGTRCDLCGHNHYREEHDGGAFVSEGCSEFCATATEEERAAFRTLQPGEYGVWPCSECGGTTEGDYTPGAWCSSCDPKRAKRVRGELLRECLRHVPPELAQKIRSEIDGASEGAGRDPREPDPTRFDRVMTFESEKS